MTDNLTESAFGSNKPQANNGLPSSPPIIILVVLIALLVALTGARYMSLDADPSPDYIPIDSGYHIDEGYKTLAAKNSLIFGKTSWNENDQYRGWMKASPLTQWPYYFSFKNIDLELSSARLVTVFYFCLFIVAVLVFLNKRYGLMLSLAAALLLAADAALFNFSRSALFEIALVLFVYLGFLIVSRVPNDKPLLALVAFIVPALIAMFTVKLSAILYCVPAIVAFSYLFATNSVRNNARKPLYFSMIGVVVLIGAYITRDTWVYRIPLDAILYVPEKFLLNPMPELSVLALLLGYACVLHLVLVKPKALYDDLYRLSLTVTVIFTPVILALFKYNPPRYYIVIIPACLLLIIEWFHIRQGINQNKISLTLVQKILAVMLFIPLSMFILRAINILVLENVPYNIGDDPGISLPGIYKIFPVFLIGLSVFVFVIRKKLAVVLASLISIFVIVQFVSGVVVQTNVLMNPSYDSQKIRSALGNIMTESESVAGDWAPFFTAEAPIRSFYMSKNINVAYPEHLAAIKPDYFLHSDSPFDPMTLELLESNDSIVLGDPKLLGTYNGNDVQLYRINYK